MGYTVVTWRFKDSIETEIKWKGNYGAKGEKRAPRKKATPEQIKKQNQRNKINGLRRLIKANFGEGDLWCTYKYPKGTRKTIKEYKKDFKEFRDECRKQYRKRGAPFKYIYRLEVGKRGGVHIHMICNRLEPEKGQPDTDKILQKAWKHGRINFESLYDAGGYQALAEYMAKQAEEDGQLAMFEESEKKVFRAYQPSRNLIRPEPEIKEYKRRTVKSIALDPPDARPGYWVDKNSIRQGINPYTGLSYCHYIEYRIKPPWEGG
ncbi:MAG: hypothetical protein J6K15_06195 [Lachnospiraceae bacterium]|nr:hypothetical protein [Lachnospiraceae bacterium]